MDTGWVIHAANDNLARDRTLVDIVLGRQDFTVTLSGHDLFTFRIRRGNVVAASADALKWIEWILEAAPAKETP